MNRVTGIGGIFFKSKDPETMRAWYEKHLGLKNSPYGTVFSWKSKEGKPGSTVWSLFKEESNYFSPSEKPFMFNYRVENLEELLKVLKDEGVTVVGDMQVFDYGKFGWIMDPEGNKIELWEPLGEEEEGAS